MLKQFSELITTKKVTANYRNINLGKHKTAQLCLFNRLSIFYLSELLKWTFCIILLFICFRVINENLIVPKLENTAGSSQFKTNLFFIIFLMAFK